MTWKSGVHPSFWFPSVHTHLPEYIKLNPACLKLPRLSNHAFKAFLYVYKSYSVGKYVFELVAKQNTIEQVI